MFKLFRIFGCCALFLLSSNTLFAQLDTTQQISYARKNTIATMAKPYVMLVSLDGFRWDLAKKYGAKNLLQLAQEGVEAAGLTPTFPSLTFPNHYTVVTGLYPAKHGLIENNFYDPTKDRYYLKSTPNGATDSTWYGGTPLWMLAEAQGMLSAVYFWPGSEFSRDGLRPSYYYKYNEVTPMPQRLSVIKNWLNLPVSRRPHFISIYFPEVDKAAHAFTIESEQVKKAVLEMDDMIDQLRQIIKDSQLPVNLIILSDHGMTTIKPEESIMKPKALAQEGLVVPAGNALLHVYVKDKTQIKSIYKALQAEKDGYDVYLKNKVPKAWHYGAKEDQFNRIGDLLLVAKTPRFFNINNRKPNPGQHGIDNRHPDMAGIFYAQGPQIKAGLRIPAFENIHVYPYIAKILDLKITDAIDGDLRVLEKTLNK